MKNSINFKEACFPDFSAGNQSGRNGAEDYTSLLMDVPLDVRVEIGKAKLKMRDVLNLAQGSIIRLEKQAGAPVEVVANNRTVARGDVIVIDDNFGVRITEIISDKKLVRELEKATEEKVNFSESIPSAVPSDQNEDAESEEDEEDTPQDENEE